MKLSRKENIFHYFHLLWKKKSGSWFVAGQEVTSFWYTRAVFVERAKLHLLSIWHVQYNTVVCVMQFSACVHVSNGAMYWLKRIDYPYEVLVYLALCAGTKVFKSIPITQSANREMEECTERLSGNMMEGGERGTKALHILTETLHQKRRCISVSARYLVKYTHMKVKRPSSLFYHVGGWCPEVKGQTHREVKRKGWSQVTVGVYFLICLWHLSSPALYEQSCTH